MASTEENIQKLEELGKLFGQFKGARLFSKDSVEQLENLTNLSQRLSDKTNTRKERLEALTAAQSTLNTLEQKALKDKIKTQKVRADKGSTVAERRAAEAKADLSKMAVRLAQKEVKLARELTGESLKQVSIRKELAKEFDNAGKKGFNKFFGKFGKVGDIVGKKLGASLGKLMGPVGWILMGIEKIVKLFVSLQKTNVEIARTFGTTTENADILRRNLIKSANATGQLFANGKRFLEVQKAIAKEVGFTNLRTTETLETVTLLQYRMGLSAGEAAAFGSKLAGSTLNAKELLESFLKSEVSIRRQTGSSVSFQKSLQDAQSASEQTLANFNGNIGALASASAELARFGANLKQAEQISKSLLNFEQSIGSELEAELLTGRQLNFERARGAALQGDVLTASKEVLKQVGTIEDFRRLNVIQQEAIAKAAGLEVNELAKSLRLRSDANLQRREFLRIAKEEGLAAANQFAQVQGFTDNISESIRKTATVQETFNESVSKLKDQVNILANTKAIDKFTSILINFAEKVASGSSIVSALFSSDLGDPRTVENYRKEEEEQNQAQQQQLQAQKKQIQQQQQSNQLLQALIQSNQSLDATVKAQSTAAVGIE